MISASKISDITTNEFMANRHLLQFDGGSRGNPGISGCGFVLYGPSGESLVQRSYIVGTQATNHEAEYEGLIAGLEEVARQGNIANLEIQGDSALVLNQLIGNWQVKAESLIPLHKKATDLMTGFNYKVTHITRLSNQVADKLANHAMDMLERRELEYSRLPAL